MTPQDHNKVIGIMHLIWGGFHALTMLFFIPFLWFFRDMMARDPHAPPEMTTFFTVFMVFIAVWVGALAVPPLATGYAMLKRKSWAKVMGIVSACFAALSFPFGTALCVYTLWFLFGEGQNFHKTPEAPATWRGSLTDANRFDWEAQRTSDAGRRREYVPPPQPPDWRG
jgi:hypothetical protein